jgi:hypothetical protein
VFTASDFPVILDGEFHKTCVLQLNVFSISERVRGRGGRAAGPEREARSDSQNCSHTRDLFCSNVVSVSGTQRIQALVRGAILPLRVLLCAQHWHVALQRSGTSHSCKGTNGAAGTSE